jgi:catechol 2,3-dioxygenase-like lactoylglutathione lyase family enzyme
MIAQSVHHVSLCVTDLDASLRFYRDLLGLGTLERPDFGVPGAWLDAGNAQIHLIVAPEGFDTGRPPSKLSPLANHLAFGVEDYEKGVAFFESEGFEVTKTSPEIGQFWIGDPSGHVIEFNSTRL